MMIHGIPMTDGSPWKHILRFAFPVLLGSLLQQFYNTADTVIVGNFSGEDALSAVGTTSTSTFFFMALAVGFSAGNGVVVARYFGAEAEKEVKENAASGIVFLMFLGVLSTILGIIAARPVFKNFVAVPESILDLTVLYFRIYCIGLIFQFGYNILAGILRAVGDSAATLYFLLISSVLNILLDLLFVAVFHWGVSGAAWATNIAQFLSFIAAWIYMYRRYPLFRFKKSDFKWDNSLIAETFKIGFPISLQMMVVSFGLTMIQRVVNSFGQVMTASFTVGQRMEMYVRMPVHAMNTTLATYTGQNLGAGKIDRVKNGTFQALLISVILTASLALTVGFFPDMIIRLFGISSDAAVYCRMHLHALAWTSIILSLYLPVFGVFQGAGHSSLATFIVLLSLGIRVLSTYYFKDKDIFGYSIIWWNALFGFGIGFLVTWWCYFSRRWQKNALMKVI